jgi:hypothetical protein
MAKSRYSKSKKGKSRRGKRSRHTKRHSGRRPHHTRRRVRRGGASNPGAPEIVWYLKPNQLLPGLPNFQRGGGHGGGHHGCPGGGVQQPTGGSIAIKGLEITKQNPACGRN